MWTHDDVIAEDHRVGRIAAREWRRGFWWGVATTAILELALRAGGLWGG